MSTLAERVEAYQAKADKDRAIARQATMKSMKESLVHLLKRQIDVPIALEDIKTMIAEDKKFRYPYNNCEPDLPVVSFEGFAFRYQQNQSLHNHSDMSLAVKREWGWAEFNDMKSFEIALRTDAPASPEPRQPSYYELAEKFMREGQMSSAHVCATLALVDAINERDFTR